MTNTSKTLTFFGSGPVATATLEALDRAGFKIALIITKPRASTHRGGVPVLEWAAQHKIPVLTPKDSGELTDLLVNTPLQSNVGLVVDYGIIMKKAVIDLFPLGIINSHFSLLPEWRGPDPITFSVLSGQRETGVSLMLIKERLDEGKLLIQEKFVLRPNITTPELTDELVAMSNRMLKKYIPQYIEGKVEPYNQSDKNVSYSRKLTKQDSIVDLAKSAETIEREVRAFAGWPRSRLKLNGRTILITKSRVVNKLDQNSLSVKCGDNTYLEITELIAPSGKKMNGAEYLRGYAA